MQALEHAAESIKNAVHNSGQPTESSGSAGVGNNDASSTNITNLSTKQRLPKPKDPGHPYSQTSNIHFSFHSQKKSPAPFGYEYFISLPPTFESSPSKSWPLILFLHGAGESQRGANESYASIRHGVPKVILCYDKLKSGVFPPTIDIPLAPRLRRSGKVSDRSAEPVAPEVCELLAENFITVTPSLNMGTYKSLEKKVGHKIPELRANYFGYGWNASILSALLDELLALYPTIDPSRIHVTGFSMGGYGTWELALHSPSRFATLMPICGGGDAIRAKNIKDVPHWVHHGDLDDIIPLTQSIQMVNALRKAGAKEVEFTRYPELKHDSWTEGYANGEVYRWMLGKRRQGVGEEKVVPEETLVTVGGAGGA